MPPKPATAPATTSESLGGQRSTRKEPPLHFTLQIHNFSLLLETKVNMYKSGVFEAGGYKWSLTLYPNGKKEDDSEGYISLYLMIEETNNFQSGWHVNVTYKFFVYDQMKSSYLTIQNTDGDSTKFHQRAKSWGFRRLISLETFRQKSNGYLMGDYCVFGAELFIMKRTGMSESLKMMKPPPGNKFAWTLDRYSTRDLTYYFSDQFSVGGSTWKLQFYPKGNQEAKDKFISFYLELVDAEKLLMNRKVYAEYKLRVLDQINDKHHERKVNNWFSPTSVSWGFPKFLALEDLSKRPKGFIYNDAVMVEVEILVVSESKVVS